MIKNADGTLGVFGVRRDGNLYYSAQTAPGSYNWTGWTAVGSGTVNGIPGTVLNATGRVEAFEWGSDNALWRSTQLTPGGMWSGWTTFGGILIDNPKAAVDSNSLMQVFVEGTDHGLWYIGQNAPALWF
jgi:hypothetical protein